MSIFSLKSLSLSTLLILILTFPVSIFAQEPFDCSSILYQVLTDRLHALDPSVQGYRAIGEIGAVLNGIGYNAQDDFMY